MGVGQSPDVYGSHCLVVGGNACCSVGSILACSNVAICGSLSKASGYFDIVHPIPALSASKRLRHSFIEGPQADNIYSGVVQLTAGSANINIDSCSNMTEGTFVALNRCIRTFANNESDWDPVRTRVSGNVVTVESCVVDSAANVSWMVIGERHDPHMCENPYTDVEGGVIAEYDKPEEGPAHPLGFGRE